MGDFVMMAQESYHRIFKITSSKPVDSFCVTFVLTDKSFRVFMLESDNLFINLLFYKLNKYWICN